MQQNAFSSPDVEVLPLQCESVCTLLLILTIFGPGRRVPKATLVVVVVVVVVVISSL